MRCMSCFTVVALLGFVLAEDKPAAPSLSNKDPLTPAEEQKTFKIAPGFKIELAASEPNVIDPVAMAFDENGRLFVAEMSGYPNAGVGTGTISSGKIRLLEDKAGDGVFTRSTVFAEGLRFPMSVLPWKNGIIVAVAPEIIYLEDTDGDGKADKKRVLYTGFDLANIQQLVNSLTWGLDGWVYGVAGNNGGTIRSADKPDMPPVTLRNRAFRFKPDVPGSLEPTTGGGQYGLTSDPWGRWFTSTNSQHLRHMVLPDHALRRNPSLPVRAVTLDIPEHGAACKVFRISPFEAWRVERTKRRKDGPDSSRFPTTELVPGGYVTSACSPLYYDAALFPGDYRGSIYVCDPANNLVLRDVLSENGATFIARRGHADSEFLASTDNWFRPVWLSLGPDGGMYVLDFYREVIETPLSLPEDIKKRLNLETRGRGRIWRVLPEKATGGAKPALGKATSEQLVKHLADENAWWRTTAQRLLLERQDKEVVKVLAEMARQKESARGRVHAIWTLNGLKSLTDSLLVESLKDAEPGVREQALRLAEERLPRTPGLLPALAKLVDDPSPRVRFQLALTLGASSASERLEPLAALLRKPDSDTWTQTAVFSSCGKQASTLLMAWINQPGHTKEDLQGKRLATIVTVATLAGATASEAELAEVVNRLFAGEHVTRKVWRMAILEGIGEGLRNNSRSLIGLREVGPKVRTLFPEVGKLANYGSTLDERVTAIRLLGHAPFAETAKTFRDLLAPQQPPEVQLAVIRAVSPLPEKAVGPLLLERWAGYSPTVRRECTEAVFARSDRVLALLDAVEKKSVPASHLEPARVLQLRKHRDAEVRRRAEKVLAGSVAPQRQKVIDLYQPALELKADKQRGKIVFKKSCATCHRLENEGYQVGAELLAALKNKTREQLLIDILDPSREVDPRFQNYTVVTKKGQTLTGLLASETASSITLKRGEGAEDVLLRSQIEEITATGLSLMPDNLETQINKQELADLIEYLLTVTK
jgi:putative membrane-bound dehydrogenase-like protein